MKERPILFSGPMVRAILDGRKTQTRRVMRVQPKWISRAWYWGHRLYDKGAGVQHFHTREFSESLLERWARACPYGASGDRLWVRETWAYFGGDEYLYQQHRGSVFYQADGAPKPTEPTYVPGGRWRPSIHMPRWASRLTLEVTEVRVQRVQEISEEDARAEGLPPYEPSEGDGGAVEGPAWYRIGFSHLWDSINGKRTPWACNPWCWALTFRRVQP